MHHLLFNVIASKVSKSSLSSNQYVSSSQLLTYFLSGMAAEAVWYVSFALLALCNHAQLHCVRASRRREGTYADSEIYTQRLYFCWR